LMYLSQLERSASKSSYVENPNDIVQAEVLQSKSSRFIISPTSRFRLFWDLASLFLLIYDSIMIPIGLFNPEEHLLLTSMDWIILIFWTLDMVASLFTGYVERGISVMSRKKIIQHYLRTWFLLDVMVNGADWIVTFWMSLENGTVGGVDADVSGLMRIFRAVRITRLLRVAKMKQFVRDVKDRIKSEVVFLLVAAGQLCATILFMSHLLGSAWYMIGDVAMLNGGRNWISANDLANEPLMFRYFTSFRFSLSYFVLVGPTTVVAQNEAEQFFSIMLMVIGWSMFAFCLASINTWVMHLRNDETSRQLWWLRRYLRQEDVPREVRYRVLRYLDDSISSSKDKVDVS